MSDIKLDLFEFKVKEGIAGVPVQDVFGVHPDLKNRKYSVVYAAIFPGGIESTELSTDLLDRWQDQLFTLRAMEEMGDLEDEEVTDVPAE